MCPHGRAHWRHLANTTEPSVYGGDVVSVSIYFDHLLLFGRIALLYVDAASDGVAWFVCRSVCLSCSAKTAEAIEMLSGVGPRKHALDEVYYIGQCAHMGGHIGAIWRIRLNRSCAAASRGLMSNYFDHLFLLPDDDDVPAVGGDGQRIGVKARDAATAEHVPDAVHAQRNQIHDHIRRQSLIPDHLVIPASDVNATTC